MQSMTVRSATMPISSKSLPRGRRARPIAIVRASAADDTEEGTRIGRRETLLGGASAAAAAAAAASGASLAVPRAAFAAAANAATSTPSALSPSSDGAVPFNCSPREPPVRLGRSELFVTPLAVGAWSWGDKTAYWGYSDSPQAEFGRKQCAEAYKASLEAGIAFIDTAEAYGFGASEELIASFAKEMGNAHPVIATKFAPLPWRGRKDVLAGAKRSLERLQLSRLGL